MSRSTASQIISDVALLHDTPVGLVLGANRVSGRSLNPFYSARIAAAADLFHRGKVRGLLVSGDNRRAAYNEPEMMKEDLVAAGVPAEFITLDYAGFRTLDSIVRAKEVFGQSEIIVVSQRSHLERALWIASERGLKAQGYVASDPQLGWRIRNGLREIAARCGACVDLWLLHRQPHFLGPRETVKLRDDLGLVRCAVSSKG